MVVAERTLMQLTGLESDLYYLESNTGSKRRRGLDEVIGEAPCETVGPTGKEGVESLRDLKKKKKLE